MTIGWFPRYAPDGTHLTWERSDYYQAQWFTSTTEIAHNGAHLLIGGEVTTALAQNELTAGGGLWAGWRPDVGVTRSWAPPLKDAGCPTLNPYGVFGYVDTRQTMVKTLIWNEQPVSRGSITDVRASRTALVWLASGRTWGLRLDRPDAAQDIQAAEWEFRPIPIDTPEGPWVLNHTHTGIVLRPFGDVFGYRLDNDGQTYYPDATYRTGTIVAVFTNDRGEQTEHPFDLSAPRVNLRGIVVPPPPPEDPPVADNLETVKRVRAKYPTPLGARHWEFLVELAQATGAWLYRKEAGDNCLIPALGKRVSLDVIGRGTLGDVWVDVLGDAEGAAIPTWDEHPNAAGEYVDVRAVQLPGDPLPPPPPPPTDDPPPTGDLAVRLARLEGLVAGIRQAMHGV